MKTTYLLVAFIAITTMFFYFVSALIQQTNLSGAGAATSNAGGSGDTGLSSAIKNQQQSMDTSSTKNSLPLDFRGPIGQPGAGFIGPKSQPPNY